MEPQGQKRPLRDLTATFGKPRLAQPAGFQGYARVVADEIARELDLYVRAAEAGQRGEPPAHAQRPDAIETAIGAAIERRAQEATLAYRTHLEQHDAAIRRTLLADDERAEVETACRGLLEEIGASKSDIQNRLATLWRDRVEPAEAELRDFQVRHARKKPPKRVSALERVLRAVILGAIAALGAFVYRHHLGGERAGFSGLVQAALWSVLSIGLAIGYARRGLSPLVGRGFVSKLLGVVTAIVFVVWLLAVNLLAAHYYDVRIAHDGDATPVELWHHIARGALVLDTLHSWLLVAFGLGASVLAALVAAGMAEIYPGYAAAGRKWEAAREEHRIAVSAASERLAAMQRTAAQELGAAAEVLACRERDSRTAADARDKFHRQFLDHLDELADAYGQLCRRYREINTAVQGDKAPRYFALEVERPECLADPDLPQLSQAREGWTEAIEHLRQQTQEVAALTESLPFEVDESGDRSTPTRAEPSMAQGELSQATT